jgi:hypothetical protein
MPRTRTHSDGVRPVCWAGMTLAQKRRLQEAERQAAPDPAAALRSAIDEGLPKVRAAVRAATIEQRVEELREELREFLVALDDALAFLGKRRASLAELAEWVRDEKGGTATPRDLSRGFRRFRGASLEARKLALRELADAGYGVFDGRRLTLHPTTTPSRGSEEEKTK